MGKKLATANAVMTFILLLIVLFLITYFLFMIKKTKKYVKTLVCTFLPTLTYTTYEYIDYPVSLNNEFCYDSKYNLSFFISCLMSIYNITFKKDPCFPHYIKYVKKIGENGYLLNYENKYNIMCFRGTISKSDIFTDLDGAQTSFIDLYGMCHENLKVHRGFHSIWLRMISDIKSMGSYKKLFIIGHSLGGACAHLAATGIYISTGIKPKIITFGSPKFGNEKITSIVKSTDIINKNDIIPCLPPSVLAISGERWVYSAYSNEKYMDIQTGSTFGNHSLVSYSYGINEENISNKKAECLWAKPLLY